MHHTQGASLSGGIPLACSNTTCFKYDAEHDTWHSTGTFHQSKNFAGYAFNKAMGLVVAGGQDGGVENTTDGVTFEVMTSLPSIGSVNCLASPLEDTLIETGGDFRNKTSVFRARADTWTAIAKRSLPRYGSSCGVVTGPLGREVVIVGGLTPGEPDESNITEIFNLKSKLWRHGDPFPNREGIQYASVVQIGDTMLVVGGNHCDESYCPSDKIFEYIPTSESWELLPFTLKKKAYYTVSFLVPISLFPSCGT